MEKNKSGYYDEYVDARNLVRHQITDAEKWANSFMAQIAYGRFSKNNIDEGLMIAWFASAIENAKDSMHGS